MRQFLFSAKPWTADVALLLLRMAVGLMMMFGHGWHKLSNFSVLKDDFHQIAGLSPAFALSIAIFAEVCCSMLVMMGLGMRLALVPLIVTMLGAVGLVHIDDSFEQMERAMLYLIPYLALFLLGAGRLSLDAIITHQRSLDGLEEDPDPW
jgi:putative oxidoreductase